MHSTRPSKNIKSITKPKHLWTKTNKTKSTNKKCILWNYKVTKTDNPYHFRTISYQTLCFSYYSILQHQICNVFSKVPDTCTSVSSLLFLIIAASNWKQLKKALSWNHFHLYDSLIHICERYLQLHSEAMRQLISYSVFMLDVCFLINHLCWLLCPAVLLLFVTCRKNSVWNCIFLPPSASVAMKVPKANVPLFI